MPPAAPAPAGLLPADYELTGFGVARAPPAPAPVPPGMPAAAPTPMAPAFVPAAAPFAQDPPPGAAAMAPRPPPSMAMPPPAMPPAMQATPASGDMSAMLANLGLRPQDVPPDTMAQLGQIVRIVVQGLMEVLLARKQVKDNFRMAMTIIRPRENNPLKFSASPEDAMYTLFVKRNPGFLEPVEAFREAFDDLSFHQLATLAGMRAAFFATLSRFDPAALEAQWDKAAGKKSGGLFGGGKGAYWEQFRQHYTRMTHDSEANFQQVFGEAFVRAYDDQIRKLQDARARNP
jgi:type VI secretion system FHA domain protein